MSRPSDTQTRTAPRVKWHKLRRRKSDPPFLRDNLRAALAAGAPCEVDIQLTADAQAVCLHDVHLDRETTGHGPVAAATRAEIERLRQRDEAGAAHSDAPLFLDELAAIVRAHGASQGAHVQLDVKAPLDAWTRTALDHVARTLRDADAAFIASAYDWDVVQRLVRRVPGLAAGFDPLRLYPRTFDVSADDLRALAARTLQLAPDAAIYYLEARLVLTALERGVNLIEAVAARGAEVDVWTLDYDRPRLQDELARLIAAGCHQITSNDPDSLVPLVARLV
jgi:glycerophosphoryl diester phosphodiesterase